MKQTLFLAGILAAVVVAPAFAKDDPPIDLQLEAPAAQFDGIRQALDTEDYAEITAADRRTVLDLLDRMEEQLANGVDALNEDQKVRLFNWQDQANMILVGAAEDSRLVCRREQKVGTRFKTTHCETVAERRRVREANQQQLRDMPRQHDIRSLEGG